MSKTLPEILSKLEQLSHELDETRDAMAPLQDKCLKLCERISKLSEQRDLLKLEIRPKPDEIDFDIVLPKDAWAETSVNRKERVRQLGLLHLDAAGVWMQTGQGAVRIALVRSKPAKTKAVFDSLSLLLPHIMPDSEGLRWIDIFEHTLSEYCSWTLGVVGDNENSKTLLLRNGREYAAFPNLMAALEYCQENHYYEE
jgi:hypothetical protein